MRQFCPQVILENFFEPCILFLLLKGKNYGYELHRELRDRCGCQVNIGNLYRGLNRLAKGGYIVKEKAVSQIGPARYVYALTDSGRKHLATWIENLKQETLTVNKLITNYQNFYDSNQPKQL